MRTTRNLRELQQQSVWKRVDALTTRLSGIASTIRASLYKNGERNVINNITEGIGYEGVIEKWEFDNNQPIK